MHKNFPNPDEYLEYYNTYIKDLKEFSLLKAIKHKEKVTKRVLHSIPKNKWDYAYAENKWSVVELIQHIIDAERIFLYRALHILREDPNPIYSFDENEYVIKAKNIHRSPKSIRKEYLAISKSTYHFFENLSEEDLKKQTTYNNSQLSVRALGYIACGHAIHHSKVLKERYLKNENS